MLITLAMVLYLAPPPQYDHEPNRPVRVLEMDGELLNAVCRHKGRQGYVVGCSGNNTIFVINTATARAYDIILRHEKAHINGWHHHDT